MGLLPSTGHPDGSLRADAAGVAHWLRAASEVLSRERDVLTALDRAVGDGDHGENLDRGFRSVVAELDARDGSPQTPGAVLRLVATTLISTVGGAAGPLYGTAFLRAGAALGDAVEVDASAAAAAIEAALAGLVVRGRAEPGDKTMVDAWSPAAQAARTAADDGAGLPGVLAAAAAAAEEGASATVPLVARKGRASYLGERSRGHRDPGAASTALLLRSAADLGCGSAGPGAA